MLKRCLVFASSFLIFAFYQKMTSILMHVGNPALFIACEFLFALVFYLLAKKLQIFEIRKLHTNDWLVYISGLVAYLFSLGLTEFIQVSSGGTEFIARNPLPDMIFVPYLCIIGPLMEEMVFRGTLQNGAFHNFYLGVLVSSAVFSLAHEPNDIGSFVYYFVIGLVLGYVYKRSDNLSTSILLHVTVNTLFWIQPYLH